MPGPSPALCTFPDDFVQEALDTVSPPNSSGPNRPTLSACAASSMSSPPWETTRRPKRLVCPLARYNAGEVAGPPAISPSKIMRAAAERLLFPPLDQALIRAMAREVVAETKEPLSRQSVAELGVVSPSGVG